MATACEAKEENLLFLLILETLSGTALLWDDMSILKSQLISP